MVELNSSNLYENGKKIIKLVDELENNIYYIFKRMEGMSTVTGEWKGTSATNFIKNIKKDKKQYKDWLCQLRNYGNNLLKQAEIIDSCCRKVEL